MNAANTPDANLLEGPHMTHHRPCTGSPLWTSDRRADRLQAALLCGGCPIKPACAETAFTNGETWGVWGGIDIGDQRTYRCGTDRGWYAHHARREPPCERCERGHAREVAQQRRARLRAEHAAGGSEAGWWLHRRLGEPPCRRCRAALNAAKRERWAQRTTHSTAA